MNATSSSQCALVHRTGNQRKLIYMFWFNVTLVVFVLGIWFTHTRIHNTTMYIHMYVLRIQWLYFADNVRAYLYFLQHTTHCKINKIVKHFLSGTVAHFSCDLTNRSRTQYVEHIIVINLNYMFWICLFVKTTLLCNKRVDMFLIIQMFTVRIKQPMLIVLLQFLNM